MTAKNDEIQKIMVSVFELTGCKVSADDPIVAMMLIQRREMAELIQQHQAQQLQFLEQFNHYSQSIITSSNEFKEQKQIIISEILKTNADEMALNESKLYAAVSQRIQEQFSNLCFDFMKDLETRMFRLMMILLVIQVAVLVVSLMV